MILLFVWENYFRKKTLLSWKNIFTQKYSEFNIFHIQNYRDYDLNFYAQNLLSSGFFSNKNLFIIDDFPGLWSSETDSETEKYTEFFLNNLPNISDDNTVIFNSQKVDKRSKLYKLISSTWEIKDFEIVDAQSLKNKLSSIYEDKVSPSVLDKMIDLKWVNFENIKNELDKILITNHKVSLTDLDDISKDLEENIFEIMNLILNNQIKQAIQSLRDLQRFLDNHYLLYNSLVANFRFYFYVFSLQKLWVSNTQIKNQLDVGKRAFLIDKTYKMRKSQLILIYEKLCQLDEKMKLWKLIGNGSDDFMFELEKCFFV